MALPSDLILSVWAQLPLHVITSWPLTVAQLTKRNQLRGINVVTTIGFLTPYETQLKAAILSGEAAYEAQILVPTAFLNSIRDPAALPILTDQICRGSDNLPDHGLGILTALRQQNYPALAWLLVFSRYNLDSVGLAISLRAGDIVLTPALAKLWRAYRKIPNSDNSMVLDGAFEIVEGELSLGFAIGWLFTHNDLPYGITPKDGAFARAFHNRKPLMSDYEVETLGRLATRPTPFRERRVFPEAALRAVQTFDPATMRQRAGPLRDFILANYEPSAARESFLGLLAFIFNPREVAAGTTIPPNLALMFGRSDLVPNDFSLQLYETLYGPRATLFYYCLDFTDLLNYLRRSRALNSPITRDLMIGTAILRGFGLEFLETPGPLENFWDAAIEKYVITNSFLVQYLFNDIIIEGKAREGFHFRYGKNGRELIHEIANSYVAKTWQPFGININVTNEVFNQRLAAVQTLLNALT